MKINLNEIPAEGKDFVFTTKTGELNELLSDLIGGLEFSTQFTILPMTQPGAYELRGFVKTTLPEDCSRCGLDFKFPVHERINHLLMSAVSTDLPRDGFMQKANHFSDLTYDGPEITEFTGHHFEAGEFIHELIALAEPFNPAPDMDKHGKCQQCGLKMEQIQSKYSQGEAPDLKTNPFQQLKGLKLN